MANRFWPDEDAIGRRLTIRNESTPRQVVGVVRHVKHYGVNAESRAEMYLPQAQDPVRLVNLVVRTVAEPTSLASAIRNEVQALDEEQPVYNIRTMEQVIAEQAGPQQFNMLLFAIFAAVALLLASVGIYGVMAYSVTQRTHEIGIRLALGARTSDVLKMVVRQGMTLALMGVTIGLGAAFAMTRVLSSLLYGVSATDPMTFIGVAMLLTIVALLSCYIPARRATKVDPMVALRYE